jgi:hypothetical protein
MDMNQLLRALGLQQAYQTYQQNIGQPFANVAGPFGRGLLGLDKPEYGQEQAYRTGQAVGNMPAVSAPVGAFKAAMQAPGLLADATQMAKQMGPELAGLLGLTAFHGSPHRFSKFDASKIGTGEGIQAYGHGLYFAENPNVASEYKRRLSGFTSLVDGNVSKSNVDAIVGNQIQALGADKAKQYFLQSADQYERIGQSYKPALETASRYRAFADYVDQLSGKSFAQNEGALYKVDIPDEMIGKMLDWDKPLGQQKELKDVLNKIRTEIALPKLQDAEGAGFAYQALANAVGGQVNASALLQQYGIPGIRYLDRGSRSSGQGTRNFVVFPGEEEALKMLSVE